MLTTPAIYFNKDGDSMKLQRPRINNHQSGTFCAIESSIKTGPY